PLSGARQHGVSDLLPSHKAPTIAPSSASGFYRQAHTNPSIATQGPSLYMNSIIRAPRILVFDSGVGGLSILRELQRKLPLCEWTYASDNEAFPYGIKSETELTERVDQVLHGLLQIRAADMIVVACNTASTLTLPHIRRRFSQPIVGVVPAIKPAAARSRSKVIGLLATPATVTRPYTQELIQQ